MDTSHNQPAKSEREIFLNAMELNDPKERSAFLKRACGENAMLLARVQLLLDYFQQTSTFLQKPAVSLNPQNPADLAPSKGSDAANLLSHSEGPCNRIGRYKLLQKIGEGGGGSVYMAEQEEPVRRRVALKIIKLGMDTHSVIARFEAERQALALMDHPNIAKVLDAGATESGRPYFVMELVRGIKITDYCDQNTLSTRQRLDLFVQICRAIQHAHQKGVIHRDIKPSNILVTVNDGVPVPKVIDFGIAKATQGRLTDKTLFTAFEQFLGTPAYMSPEQAVMTSLDIDTRSDVYSLGVLLYELLTGKTPFDPRELLESGLDEMRRTIQEKEPARPSTRFGTMLNAELVTTAKKRRAEPDRIASLLRGDLDWIVMKALDKDRTKRYETAISFAEDIDHFLKNEPVSAAAPSVPYRVFKFVRRHRTALGFATALGITLLAGFGVSLWQAVRAGKQATLAETRRRQAEASSHTAAIAQKRAEIAVHELSQQMARSHIEKAEDFLNAGDSATALAYLARVLRRDPRNVVAATRVVSILSQRAFALPVIEAQHQAPVNDAEFSPDGTRVVTASDDGSAQVWDSRTGQLLTTPLKHGAPIYSARFSPDGQRILTASDDNTARVWDVTTGRPLTDVLKHEGKVRSAEFSPDGQWVVTASHDQTARLWDAATGKLLTSSLRHEGVVRSAHFSPDGRRVLTASDDKTARIWDATTGRPLIEPLKHEGEVTSARFSPDGGRVVTASRDHTARLWDASTGGSLNEPLKHSGVVDSANFSPDGRQIVTAWQDNASGIWAARVWDPETGHPLTDPLKHDQWVLSAAFSPDGSRVATVSHDNTARVWDVNTGKLLMEPLKHADGVNSARFSPDGRRLITASQDNFARVWNINSRRQFPLTLKHGAAVNSARFSPDGGKVVTVSDDRTARIWDAGTGRSLLEPLKHLNSVFSAQFSPDARRIVTTSHIYGGPAQARVWDAQTGQPITASLEHQDASPSMFRFNSAQFSQSGLWILTAYRTTARLWDAKTGLPLQLLKHDAHVYSAQFSPDGQQVITGCDDGSARIWDANTGRLLIVPLKHRGWVRSTRFSPDGRRVATGSWDRTARVWDARSGQALTEPLQHEQPVSVAEFSPDGRRLLTASAGAKSAYARVWDVEMGFPLTEPIKFDREISAAQFSPNGERLLIVSADFARVWDTSSGEPLTEPFRHEAPVNAGQFSPDGRQVLTASADHSAQIWEVPEVSLPTPDWLPAFVEVIAGKRFNDRGITEIALLAEMQTFRRLVSETQFVSFWTQWADWVLAR